MAGTELDRLRASGAFWGPDGIADAVWKERLAQIEKWGAQNHPTGASFAEWGYAADMAKRLCDQATREGCVTWAYILGEEVCEALAEEDPVKFRAEIVQVMAVCAAILQNLEGVPA